MNSVELTIEEFQRILDAMLWILGPYMEEKSIKEHPHLLELSECYNSLYQKLPFNIQLIYPELEPF